MKSKEDGKTVYSGDSCPERTERPSHRLGYRAMAHAENGTRKHLQRWRVLRLLQTSERVSRGGVDIGRREIVRSYTYPRALRTPFGIRQ